MGPMENMYGASYSKIKVSHSQVMITTKFPCSTWKYDSLEKISYRPLPTRNRCMLYMQLHFFMYSTVPYVKKMQFTCTVMQGSLGKFTSDGRYSKQCQQGQFYVFF